MFKFYIDNVELSDIPRGWDDFAITDRLDSELKGLFKITDSSFTFYGDGYAALKYGYDTFGHCSESTFDVRIYDDALGYYAQLFVGIIQYSEIEFSFGINGLSAKVKVQDNSLFSRIRTNVDLKARPFVGRSKNDVAILPAPYFQLRMFTPSSGAYIALQALGSGQERNNTAFRVYDVLKFFIDFMSDGEIDFISNDLDDAGVYGGYMLINCHTMRMTTVSGLSQELFEQKWETFSFKDLLAELDILFNLGFRVGFNGSRPYFQIEKYENLFTNTVSQSLSGVNNISIKTAKERLFSNIEIGSELTLDEPTLVSFVERIKLVGMYKENYSTSGKCNVQRTLGLVNKWIISSNYIEDMIINGQTSAPDNTDGVMAFVKSSLNTTWYDADQSNWIGLSPPVFYNESLNNENKLKRYLGSIPNNIVAYFSADTNRFRASTTTDRILGGALITYDPIPADDDVTGSNFDLGGNYDPTAVNYNFTPPANDVYSFYANITVLAIAGAVLNVSVVRWDGGLTALQGGVILYNSAIPVGINKLSVFGSCYAVAGEKIDIQITYASVGNATLITGSYWECTNAGAGGNIATYSPDDARVKRITLSTPLNYGQYKTIEAAPTGLIEVECRGEHHYGWIEERRYKPSSGLCDFTLITKNNIIGH